MPTSSVHFMHMIFVYVFDLCMLDGRAFYAIKEEDIMNRTVIVFVLCLFCATAIFAQSEMDEEKPVIEKEASADISAIQTAMLLQSMAMRMILHQL